MHQPFYYLDETTMQLLIDALNRVQARYDIKVISVFYDATNYIAVYEMLAEKEQIILTEVEPT